MGALMYSAAFVTYALVSFEHVLFLAACLFIGTMGLIQMDVMTDTMVVERSKFEKEEVRGQMQATCYSIRFGGGVVGAVLGTIISSDGAWGFGFKYREVSLINGAVPFLLVVPLLFVCVALPFLVRWLIAVQVEGEVPEAPYLGIRLQ